MNNIPHPSDLKSLSKFGELAILHHKKVREGDIVTTPLSNKMGIVFDIKKMI